MGRRGPKPQPQALRLLHHPAPARQPAIPPNDPPRMPADLSADEIAAWDRLMSELSAVPGLASRADRGVCELVARLEPAMRRAAIVVREQGSTLESFDRDGNLKFVQTRPEATFALKTATLLKTLYAELGLTPSGRSRVNVTPTAPTSKLDAFLARGTDGR